MPVRLVTILDHPSPHMSDVVSSLALDPALASTVVYLAAANPARPWNGQPGAGEHFYRRRKPLRLANLPLLPDFGVVRLIKQLDPDAVCLSASYQLPSVQLLARYLSADGVPWFLYNEALKPCRGSLPVRMAKAALLGGLRRAAGAVCIGSKAAAGYRDLIGPGKPVTIGGYAEDLSPFLATPLPAYAGGLLRLVYFGRLVALKRLDLVLEALEGLPPACCELLICGTGPERDRLLRRADAAGLNVRYCPWIPHESLPALLASQHALVLASEDEGWGMAIPEAMAAGLVVLARETVGACDLIAGGHNGILLPDDDFAAALRHWIGILRSDPPLVRNMAERARATAEAFTPAATAAMLGEMAVRVLREAPVEPRRRVAVPALAALRARVRQAAALIGRKSPAYHGLRVAFYHFIRGGDRFEEHLRFFSGEFQVFDPRQSFAGALTSERGLALSIDDGFRDSIECAGEALGRYGLKATFFLPTCILDEQFRRRDLGWFLRRRLHQYANPAPALASAATVIELLRAGHAVGSHTHSHLPLGCAPAGVIDKELSVSRRALERFTGQAIDQVAYPYGQPPRPEHLPLVERCGYRLGWTIRRGINGPLTPPLLMHRDHFEGDWNLNVVRWMLSRPALDARSISPAPANICESW